MEEASKSAAAFAFRRHCKSHLKSQTYLTLVRIISQCHAHPHLLEVSRPPRPSPGICRRQCFLLHSSLSF
uniref:Zinc finger CCCH domain-containing protein 65 isoform X1 n=1 Tax=Rhizophora mucronata TaxID=61149 RepID=A0A2P2KM58_RHIMU